MQRKKVIKKGDGLSLVSVSIEQNQCGQYDGKKKYSIQTHTKNQCDRITTA